MMEQPCFGTAKCAQIGLIVRDIEKSTRAYAALLGVPVPDIQMPDYSGFANTQYLGKPTKAGCKQSFFCFNDIQVELIEPDDAPSIWRQALLTNGEGVHHIAFAVTDMEKMIAVGIAQGMKLVQRGRWHGGHYAYLDASETLHTVVELLENGDFDI